MKMENGKAYGFKVEHILRCDDSPPVIIARIEPAGQQASLSNLPPEIAHWIAGMMHMHRGAFWLRETAQPDGRKRLDVGCITPTLRVAEDAHGQRVYFAAFDAPHARAIIAERALPGFDGHRLRLRKVTRLADVPPEDRDRPAHTLAAWRAEGRVADYSDLQDPDRYDTDDEPETIEKDAL